MSGLARVIRYLRPYAWMTVLGIVTTILPVLMELVTPLMVQFIIDQGIRAGDMAAVWQGSGIMMLAAILGAATTIGQGIARAQISQGIAFDLRNDLFRHIQRFSFANLDRMQTGQLMTRVSSDVDVARMFLSAGMALLLRTLMMVIGSLTMMLIIDWRLGLIMVTMLIISGSVIFWFLRIVGPLFSVVQQKLGKLNTLVQENLAGVHVVKAFVREQYEIENFDRDNVDYMEQNIKVGRYLALVMPVLLVLTNLGATIAIWRGGIDVIGGRLTIGELVAFSNYMLIGMSPLLLLSNILSMISRAEASSKRVVEVLDTEPAIQAPPTPAVITKPAGDISFENVSFYYSGSRISRGLDATAAGNGRAQSQSGIPEAEQANGQRLTRTARGNVRPIGEEVLDGISLHAAPGQKIALMGATGSGKSTLVNLIPRFYDAEGGVIKVDGVDVRNWEPVRLRKEIGVVLQQTTLFAGTVRENIAYGRPNASMREVVSAAESAQAHDFIMQMPDQYESLVEARGANLSGGQKQRIAIARALLTNPSVLILDDSTSAVDLDTELRLQQALAEKMAGTTTFIVAQRISSVVDADLILVLDDGKIAAQGTHEELLAGSEIYQEIYYSQFEEA
ncbi:MAG: ABC transporter ATP-binding protein [Caldilineaceae bacterium SB0664_bin_27]|uniref:ABC transporter ATP-binding protein n=1 Tax=Caldilineaceae bacterium SB0664_bin_27 TaxID=2605260 RepID=A0A6B0YRW4_9CHLR|nr:ABC transporter ATP-binding protein [Caldilineaceae bacterium SB0664_bin_27]